MSDERDLSNDERKLEATLSRVKPREPGIDAASIAFSAGVRSARRRLILHKAVAAALLLAVIAMGQAKTPPRVVERIVFVTSPARPPQAVVSSPVAMPRESESAVSYLNLRHDVIEYGYEALPAAPSAAGREGDVLRPGSSRTFMGGDL